MTLLMCCCWPCIGSAEFDATAYPDEEEQSVDSEPYSPQSPDFIGTVNVKCLCKTEERDPPGCPPCSPIMEAGDGSDRIAHAPAAVAFPTGDLQSWIITPRESEGIVEKSLRSKKPSLTSHHTGASESPADTGEKTHNKSCTMCSTKREENCKTFLVIKAGTIYERTPCFRWEHVNEERFRIEKAVELADSQKSDCSPDRLKMYMNIPTGWGSNEKTECETLGWYIHVHRTGQCILNHHHLRLIMDELTTWTMQVPGTVSIRYKHTSGVDVFLAWPDLRTSSKHEIEKFVETVNIIEGRKVFYYLFMENPQSFVKYMPPCAPPPSPASVTVTKHNFPKRVCDRHFIDTRVES